MKKAMIIGVLAVASIGLICLGPSLIKAQNEDALRRCEDFVPAGGTEAGIDWQVLPRPGWICESTSGKRYIGYWVRSHR